MQFSISEYVISRNLWHLKMEHTTILAFLIFTAKQTIYYYEPLVGYLII